MSAEVAFGARGHERARSPARCSPLQRSRGGAGTAWGRETPGSGAFLDASPITAAWGREGGPPPVGRAAPKPHRGRECVAAVVMGEASRNALLPDGPGRPSPSPAGSAPPPPASKSSASVGPNVADRAPASRTPPLLCVARSACNSACSTGKEEKCLQLCACSTVKEERSAPISSTCGSGGPQRPCLAGHRSLIRFGGATVHADPDARAQRAVQDLADALKTSEARRREGTARPQQINLYRFREAIEMFAVLFIVS